MEIYSTEEQQAEAIKSFFRDNGIALAVGVVLGLGGLYGWRAYNQHTIDTAEATSDSYQQLIAKAGQDDSEVLAKADSFIDSNTGSNYAVLAAFVAAKEAVEKKDLNTASEKLSWVVANSKNNEFKAVANTRLARIQIELKQYDAALKTLAASYPENYKATVAELKGDAFIAQDQTAQAREAYQAAADAGGLENNSILQLKLDNLAEVAPKLAAIEK